MKTKEDQCPGNAATAPVMPEPDAVDCNSQLGFTMVELMVSTALASFIILVAMSFVYQAVDMAELLTSKIRLNSEARLAMNLLGHGRYIDSGESRRGLHDTEGTENLDLTFSNRRVFLDENDSIDDDHSLLGTTARTALSVRCLKAGYPLPDCPSGNVLLVVEGFVSETPTLSDDRRIGGRTRETTVTLFDPAMAFRVGESRSVVPWTRYSETYWTVFGQMRD